jgi:hypothetical protein
MWDRQSTIPIVNPHSVKSAIASNEEFPATVILTAVE